MNSTRLHESFRFMELPAELRYRVYELLFFGSDEGGYVIRPVYRDLCKNDVDGETKYVESKIVLQPSGYRTHRCRAIAQRSFDLAILRTCHAVQEEAESVFYGSASFDLRSLWRTGGCHEFLQSFPRRNRRLVRRAELYSYDPSSSPDGSSGYYGLPKCLSNHGDLPKGISLLDWIFFTTFLALECPSLHDLKLCIQPEAVEPVSLTRGHAWVEALLQIKSLSCFDIPVMGRSYSDSHPGETTAGGKNLLPWLRRSLLSSDTTCNQKPKASLTLGIGYSFDLLALPKGVRARIFRYTLLPANKRLYPYIKAWYRPITRNIIPLFSTCKLIRQEAEDIVYGQAIFCVTDHYKYAWMLFQFLDNLGPRLRAKIRRVRMRNPLRPSIDSFRLPCMPIRYIAIELTLDELECIFEDEVAVNLNQRWLYDGRRTLRRHWKALFSSCQKLKLTMKGKTELTPALRYWMQHELTEKAAQCRRRRQTLRSSQKSFLAQS